MSGLILRGLLFGVLFYLLRNRGKKMNSKEAVREVATTALIFTAVAYILELIW